MSNTKASIIDCAKALFMKNGYKNVSLRDIATEAGTTIGNLTYHFPKKEALIMAIQEKVFSGFLNDFDDSGDTAEIFEKMIDSLFSISEDRKKNEFFGNNIIELCTDFESVAQNIKAFRYKVYRYYLACFEKLKNSGIIRSDISDDKYETLSYTIVHLSYTWTQKTTQYHDENFQRLDLAAALIDLLYPYLSPEGARLLALFYKKQEMKN